MSETLEDAVRDYARRTGTSVKEAEAVIMGAGLAALDGGDSLVRHIRIGMIVALNLIEADHAKAVERAWGIVSDCDVQISANETREREPQSIAPVVELRTAGRAAAR